MEFINPTTNCTTGRCAPPALHELGLSDWHTDAINQAIVRPNGLIIVAGPEGTDKIGTLYAFLRELSKNNRNISTIEDGLEYSLEGIDQSEVNPRIGFSFASALRALLRQDRDVILVEEINNDETAEIAAHAAITGHLLLSTLNAKSNLDALTRLNEIGIPSFVAGNAINTLITRHQVQTICPACKQKHQLDENTAAELEKVMGSGNADEFYKGAGCERCNHSGVGGHIGVFEVMPMDAGLKEVLNNDFSAKKLSAYAKKAALPTLLEDAFLKAKQGLITINDMLRLAYE